MRTLSWCTRHHTARWERRPQHQHFAYTSISIRSNRNERQWAARPCSTHSEAAAVSIRLEPICTEAAAAACPKSLAACHGAGGASALAIWQRARRACFASARALRARVEVGGAGSTGRRRRVGALWMAGSRGQAGRREQLLPAMGAVQPSAWPSLAPLNVPPRSCPYR